MVSSPPLREAFNRCLPLVTEFGTELGQNETLYRHFSTLQASVGAGASPSSGNSSPTRCAIFGSAASR